MRAIHVLGIGAGASLLLLGGIALSGPRRPGPIECPAGAHARFFDFTQLERASDAAELSAFGWRCLLPDGRRHGPSQEWFANGRPSLWSEWSDGEKHGRFVLWYPNGQQAAEGAHRRWRAAGRWTRWDRDGRVTDQRDFEEVVGEGAVRGRRGGNAAVAHRARLEGFSEE